MTISLYLILWLLTIHYVSDFLLQTESQALAKHHDNHALTMHVANYAAQFALALVIWPYGSAAMPATVHNAARIFEFSAVTFIIHWGTDWCTSRWNARLWQRESKRAFFRCVGLDQLAHGLQLILTAAWLLT